MLTIRERLYVLRNAVKVKPGTGYHYKNVMATILGKVSVERTETLYHDDTRLSNHYSQLKTDTGFTIWAKANFNMHKLYGNANNRPIVLVQLNTQKGEVFYSVMYYDNVLKRNWKMLKNSEVENG